MDDYLKVRYANENSDITDYISNYNFTFNVMIDPNEVNYIDYDNPSLYLSDDSFVYLVIIVK